MTTERRERDKIEAIGLGPDLHKRVECPICNIYTKPLSAQENKYLCTKCGITIDTSFQIAKHGAELSTAVTKVDKGPIAVFSNAETPNVKKKKRQFPSKVEDEYLSSTMGAQRLSSHTFYPLSNEVVEDD